MLQENYSESLHFWRPEIAWGRISPKTYIFVKGAYREMIICEDDAHFVM